MVVHVARFAPWLALFLLGCATRTEAVALSVRLADDPACRPTEPLTEVRLTALGDFGGVGATAIVTDGVRIDQFPFETEAFLGTVELGAFRGTGLVLRGESRVLRLSPLDVPCVSALAPAVGDGASFAVTDDGGFVVAGGNDLDGIATRNVRVVEAGLAGERLTMELPTRRVRATSHVVGDRLYVAGGALGETGPALDRADVIDVATGALVSSAVLAVPRRDHGSVPLADGRLLVVGGRAADDAPALASAEIVGETGSGTLTAELPFARLAPRVVRLDDGTVLVLGGYGAGTSPYSTTSVFTWNPPAQGFVDRSDEVSVRPYARFTAVPLVGGRVVWVGDARPGLSSALFRVLYHVLPDFDVPVLVESDVDLRAQMPDLEAVVATPLADGRFVMMGRDASSSPRGFVIDVGRALADEIVVDALPHTLLTLADGSVVAFSATAITTYRFRVVTRWDVSPETVLAEELAFDVASRWAFPSAVRFAALEDGARFDVPTVRLFDFDATWVVEAGSAELWLVGDDGLRAAISVRDEELSIGLCAIARTPGQEVRLERRGTRVVLGAGDATRTCVVGSLLGEVGIAVRASNGALVRAPRLTRR